MRRLEMKRFLRSRRSPAANDAGGAPPYQVLPSSDLQPMVEAETQPRQKAEPVSPAPSEQGSEEVSSVEDALAGAPEAVPGRYEARENAGGWSVHDAETDDTAEVHGYRLARMNRARADSLVEVLNRGEARRRGRNG